MLLWDPSRGHEMRIRFESAGRVKSSGQQKQLPNYREVTARTVDPRDDDADHGRDERGEVGVEVPEGGRCVARIAQPRGLPIVVTESFTVLM